MIASSTASSYSWWDQFMAGLAAFVIADARIMIGSLLSSFGSSTEPDLLSIAPVYSRMLAIALLILGAVVAFAIAERALGGQQGVDAAVIFRVVMAVFAAFSGLSVVHYVADQAALLATTWSPDLASMAARLGGASTAGASPAVHGSLLGLVLTAILLTFLALFVFLELVVRSALILVVAAFIPLVCVLAIWPRMSGAATHLGEFLIGLLLSKFVVATAVYIGFQLLLPSLVSSQGEWMQTGIAVLLIAAFSPVALFHGLRFAHASAGNVVRDIGGGAMAMSPLAPVTRLAQSALRSPAAQMASKNLRSRAGSVIKRIRKR